MTRKTVGYVRTEWTCPNCQTRNPGPQKTCTSCGMPQPENVEFEEAGQDELIKDEAELAKAQSGPDVHCYYCGSRNPAGATSCTQCGADLTQAKARTSGKVLGAQRTGPAPKIACPSCGTENEASAGKCVQCGAPLPKPQPATPKARAVLPQQVKKPWAIGVIGVLAVLCCLAAVVFFVLSNRTSDVTGTVNNVSWTRAIAIEALGPVQYEDWHDKIPAQAVVGTCTQKMRRTQDNPAPNAKEVCGTPYKVDKGSGYAEVVQDCKYQVYEDWCKYTVDEWKQADEVSVSGSDFSPQWPAAPALNSRQREGARKETYQVTFRTEQGQYTYTPGTQTEFAQYQIGSRWVLKVNTFNAVVSTEPMQ